MEDALVQCVQLSLANCLTSNATFYAEQLVAVSRQNEDDIPSEHSLHLLAMCYIQSGRHSLALEALKGCNSHKNLYLRAVAALALNLNREAEIALQPGRGIISDDDYKDVPNGAYGIYLLGVVKRRQGATNLAISHFKKALELNPLLWAAFESLCQMGAPVETSAFFGVDEQQLASLQVSSQQPLLPSLQAPPNLIKGLKGPLASVAASRAENLPKPISTPALAKKMRSIMSPGETESSHDSARMSLSRRLFETPSTPADSMIGIAASSTPLWAPGRQVRPAPQPIAVSFPDLSSARPARPAAAAPAPTPSTTTLTTNPTTTAPVAATPARSTTSSSATAKATSASTVAASPKKRLPTTTTSTTTSSRAAKATTSTATTGAPGPTPRRAVSALASTTSGSSSVASTPVTGPTAKTTARVMPARAVKVKSSVSAAMMTPIPSSLPSTSNMTTAPSNAAPVPAVATTAVALGTPTTPPVANVPTKPGVAKVAPAGPPALPSHRVRSQQFKSTGVPSSAMNMTPAPEEGSDAIKPLPALSFATGSTPAASTASNVSMAPPQKVATSKIDEEEASTLFKQPLFKTAPKDTTIGKDASLPSDSTSSSTRAGDDFSIASNIGSKTVPISMATAGAPNPDDDGDDGNADDSWTKGMIDLLGLLRTLGEATKKMEFFECRAALAEFSKLSPLAKSSPYVLSAIGRCYYELTDQERAREAFSRLCLEWPFAKLNTALYSNVLWHLRAKGDLNAFAHQAIKLEPRNADSWCAMGNAFSLEGDSENAINAFQRAAQVNPDHAYAYTLAGHEYLSREEYESARASFIEAVKVDPRHYRGWYGLGVMHFKMNDISQAKAYFKKAHLIYPKSSVLYAWMGMCEAAIGQARPAVIMLKNAVALSPENTKAKYHLASMLMSVALMDRDLGSQAAFQTNMQAAERHLSQLKMVIPRSAALHFLNARILSAQGKSTEAEQEYGVARELDPKILEHIGEEIVSYDPPEIA